MKPAIKCTKSLIIQSQKWERLDNEGIHKVMSDLSKIER